MKMKCWFLALCLLLPFCCQATDLTHQYNVSFNYDGTPFSAEAWHAETHEIDAQQTDKIFTSPDGRLRLTLSYLHYKDFPVTELHPVLECLSDEGTGLVDDFHSLSLVQPCTSDGIKVRRITGSMTELTDFTHHDVLLQHRHECDILHFSTNEGRSATAWLPYFGIDLDATTGLEIAIGWTGTWQVDMQYGDGLNLSLGQKGPVHFRMLKGERFRLPYTLIYERQNQTVEEGLVGFHRFIMEHKSPRDKKGNICMPLLPLTASGGNKTDDNMLKIIDFATKHFKIPFDTFWVDANWNGTPHETEQDTNCGAGWYEIVGDWRVNKWSHPNGNLKKVADAAHRKGMKFLLWFEPERATEQAPIVQEHPEYFHRVKNNPSPNEYLLDLGNPEAREWIVEEISRNIRETGIDVYRQDFNMNPEPIWHDMDAADRQGVSEIRHINGLYAFWDELHHRFPKLLFENCASGGRRMDVEMMSRAHSYCRDDAHMSPNNDGLTQNITLNSTPYIPFTGGETFTVPVFDTYAFLSRLGAGTVFTPTDFQGMILQRQPDQKEIDWFNSVLGVADRVRPLFMGDFYALTPQPFDATDIFCGYQLNDPKSGKGFFIVFRRPECTDSNFPLQLRGIDTESTYEVETYEGTTERMKGSQLATQQLSLPTPRSFRLVFYKKK